MAWDFEENEAVIQISCPLHALCIELLDKEFNERSNELFPKQGFIFDGWKLISGPPNVMKIYFYNPNQEKKENENDS